MAATERDLHEQHRAMTSDLAARHARVKELDFDDAEFDGQYTAMVQGAEELLAFEQTLPTRLAEPQRLRSAKIVRWSWRGQTAVAIALITVVVLDRTAWWLLLLIPHLLATLLGWSIKVTLQQHKQQRGIAFALHALCVLVILVALGVLSAWWWIIAVLIGWALIGGASADAPQQGAKK